MTKKRNYRAFRDVEEEYFRNHPEEIGSYIDEIFDDYAQNGSSAALLASLRVIAKVKGITNLAKITGMTRQGVQHALSNKGNPRFDNVNAIMHALGYRLTPSPIENTHRV
ncbi:MAG: putative addiction module antidote protein [Alphaproteobacteria bacterium]|nr:putative addiction module antidote protein [Alphaproteobacteria bacterium]